MPLCATVKTEIPEGVTVEVNKRLVRVTGPRGVVERNFKHTSLEMTLEGNTVSVSSWFSRKRDAALCRTIISHIENMVTGVTKGFRYKMRLVYAHFPITANVCDAGARIELRNFYHETKIRSVPMLPGVTISISTTPKDELVLEGNDIENVSLSAALINQSMKCANKDGRKFLDGAYVSFRGTMDQL
ncbi:ribosomal protein L6 [Kipferlia bialata]|uniref:Ribosomal protein L6 n=1 Tax=Kipferlia bialata TaxID=797122 RepID=A0A391NGU1_9EUKA|nr:ribosomal protein L6 [Kipferlia bialata]|eukprot:g8.t1